MNVCECGCEQLCNKKFIAGHNRRKKSSWNAGLKMSKITRQRMSWARLGISYEKPPVEIEKLNICICGCGLNCRRKFVQGHNAKYKRTKKTKALMSAARKGIIFTETHLRNLSESHTGKHPTEESKRKNSLKHRDVNIISKIMKNSGKKRFSYISSEGLIINMRSNWEVLYAKFLDSQNIIWQYEPKGFLLSNGHRYFPDFYLPEDDKWIEIKGWMSPRSIEKINLFKKDYPEKIFQVITEMPS